jgi:DNA topoisomerase-1
MRVGNLEYARANNSFGLTTLRDRHVRIAGATLQFSFRGKSGKYHTVRLHDRRLATIVKRCQDLPGQELFQYIDAAGERHTVDSADVNDYLRHLTDQNFTAKDVRTWAGTVLAAGTLREYGPCTSAGEARQCIVQAMEAVARRLGNTRAVCRACYVHPTILEAYLDGSLCALPLPRDTSHNSPEEPGLHPEEALVLTLLKQRHAQSGHLSQQAS